MPLIAYKNLPAFDDLRKEGRTVLSSKEAITQDIREMHIGLLNMMPDKALIETERQFMRLIGESNPVAQIFVHPFTLDELNRDGAAKQHVETYYESFNKIKEHNLDALIISGANLGQPHIDKAKIWEPMKDVMSWAWNNVVSTMTSCLATHAFMQYEHNQIRSPMEEKLWGVYRHRVSNKLHPLVRDINTIFDVPHSRYNAVSEDQFKRSEMQVLVKCETAGVHIATSADGIRTICMQGHPEYSTDNLLLEYRREVGRYIAMNRDDYPPLPNNYICAELEQTLAAYQSRVVSGKASLDDFPLSEAAPLLENTWRDSAKTMMGNWVGLVYRLTNVDRQKQFMDGINPDDPLGLKNA